MARENDPTHLSPTLNITWKHAEVILSRRRDTDREVSSSERQQGIRKVVDKKTGIDNCTWDHSRPMSARKQIGFRAH